VAKVTLSKIGPSRLLEVDWVKNSVLKDNCFVIWLGSGNSSSSQWVVHRPIGETSLKGDSWVMTPSRDLEFLLSRRESEELSSWNRKAELAKRQEVLAARKGRGLEGQTEVWTFDGAPAIQPTIRTCMAAAKAAGAKESEWLSYADSAVQISERSFKEALRTQAIPGWWVVDNPRPHHETMGGPLGDVPQKAVGYLSGLSLNTAKDKVLRVMLSIDSNESEAEDEEEEEEAPPAPKPGSSSKEKPGSGTTSPKK